MIRAETKKVDLGNKSKKFSMPENGPPKKLVGGYGKLLRTETMFL